MPDQIPLASILSLDPFEAAAARQREAVQPTFGRQQGLASNIVPGMMHGLMTLPEQAMHAAGDLQRTGDVYDPAPGLQTAMMMVGTPGVPAGALGSSIGRGRDATLKGIRAAEELRRKLGVTARTPGGRATDDALNAINDALGPEAATAKYSGPKMTTDEVLKSIDDALKTSSEIKPTATLPEAPSRGYGNSPEPISDAQYQGQHRQFQELKATVMRLGPMREKLVELGATPEQMSKMDPGQAFKFIKERSPDGMGKVNPGWQDRNQEFIDQIRGLQDQLTSEWQRGRK